MKSVLKVLLIGVMVICPTMVHAESLDIHSEEVQELINKYDIGTSWSTVSMNLNSMDEESYASIASRFVDRKDIIEITNTYSVISKETYNKAFKIGFGPDVDVVSVNVKSRDEYKTCYVYYHNLDNNMYEENHACGGCWNRCNRLL